MPWRGSCHDDLSRISRAVAAASTRAAAAANRPSERAPPRPPALSRSHRVAPRRVTYLPTYGTRGGDIGGAQGILKTSCPRAPSSFITASFRELLEVPFSFPRSLFLFPSSSPSPSPSPSLSRNPATDRRRTRRESKGGFEGERGWYALRTWTSSSVARAET